MATHVSTGSASAVRPPRRPHAITLPALLLVAVAAAPCGAVEYGRTIFADDFSANAFGPRWGHYKSASVVRDGVLVGITAPESDHSAVDNIRFDGERDL